MADGDVIRRRREVPERIEYGEAMERIVNFVDNELGNEGAPRRRPDDGEWRKQRVKTIQTLNELREKLDTICVGANYGKAAGNGAEILGGCGALIGSIMSLGGLSLGRTFLDVGNLVQNAGTFLDGLSNVIESLVSAKYLSDIQAVLEKDKELSLPLAEWLNFSRDLDVNVEEIFGVSLASEKCTTVMKVFYEFSKISSSVKSFDATMRLMRESRYSIHIGNDVKVEKLQKLFEMLSNRPQLADRVRVTFSVLSVSTGAIRVFRDGARVWRSFMGISSADVPSLQGGLNPEIPTAKEVTVFCVFQAVSLALNVISLINATNIIRHGKSKYSDALKDLTRALAFELRQMY